MDDELYLFILNDVNTESFFSDYDADDKVHFRLHSRYLAINGAPYWYVLGALSKIKRTKEEEVLVWEEKLVHPVIAMQSVESEIRRLFFVLTRIRTGLVDDSTPLISALPKKMR